jgi:hypothetical protein
LYLRQARQSLSLGLDKPVKQHSHQFDGRGTPRPSSFLKTGGRKKIRPDCAGFEFIFEARQGERIRYT